MNDRVFLAPFARPALGQATKDFFDLFSQAVVLPSDSESDGVSPQREVRDEILIVDMVAPDCREILRHLDGREVLPEVVFLSHALPEVGIEEQRGWHPFARYFFSKYRRLLAREGPEPRRLPDHVRFLSVDGMARLALPDFSADSRALVNPFAYSHRILSEADWGADPELLSRLEKIDADLSESEHERTLSRIRHYHCRGDSVKNRILADLLIDNAKYLEDGCPKRRILWIEDKPEGIIDLGASPHQRMTLKEMVVQTFSHYPNISLYLLSTNYGELFRRLKESPKAERPILNGLGLRSLIPSSHGPMPLALADFDVLLLDLNFGSEDRISGKDLLSPIVEAHSELPILVLSGTADPEILDGVLHSGADFFVPKRHASSLPIYVNRCFAAGPKGEPIFIGKSRLRQQRLGVRQDVRISLRESRMTLRQLRSRLLSGGATEVAPDLEESEDYLPQDASVGNEIPCAAEPNNEQVEDGELRTHRSGHDVFLFRQRDILRWRDVFLCLDHVEGLGDYLEIDCTTDQELRETVEHFGLQGFEIIRESYADLYLKSNTPRIVTWLSRKHNAFREWIFGITSGTLTTSGTLVGTYSATGELLATVAAVVAVGVSDSWSDAYSSYSESIAGRGKDANTEARRHALKTFVGKLVVPLTFLVVLVTSEALLGDLALSIGVCLGLGSLLLSSVAMERSVVQRTGRRAMVVEVIKTFAIGVAVVVCSYYAGIGADLGIDAFFSN